MSPNSTTKFKKPIFQSYFWPALLALFMAVVLSQWAVADQQATQEQTDPPPVDMPDTTVRKVEPAPDAVVTRVPKSYDGTSSESEAAHQQGSKLVKEVPLAEKCYEQKDGSFECVCEGAQECEILKTAEHCEPGTHWGKDGYGGCTKVPE